MLGTERGVHDRDQGVAVHPADGAAQPGAVAELDADVDGVGVGDEQGPGGGGQRLHPRADRPQDRAAERSGRQHGPAPLEGHDLLGVQARAAGRRASGRRRPTAGAASRSTARASSGSPSRSARLDEQPLAQEGLGRVDEHPDEVVERDVVRLERRQGRGRTAGAGACRSPTRGHRPAVGAGVEAERAGPAEGPGVEAAPVEGLERVVGGDGVADPAAARHGRGPVERVEQLAERDGRRDGCPGPLVGAGVE